MKACMAEGCGRKHVARGYCGSHYNKYCVVDRYPTERITCAQADCGIVTVKRVDPRRPKRYCSDLCRDLAITYAWSCRVPDAHPSRSCAVPPDHPSRLVALLAERGCEWCGTEYMPRRSDHVYCSAQCKRRSKRVRRKANESDGHTYTWTDVIRILLRFGGCCPYCEQVIDGPPDPDHVVPLSRDGSNGISNILPCCRACNSDKRDLLLSEWNADRAQRGLPPRITEWSHDDPRVSHLRRAVLHHAA